MKNERLRGLAPKKSAATLLKGTKPNKGTEQNIKTLQMKDGGMEEEEVTVF